MSVREVVGVFPCLADALLGLHVGRCFWCCVGEWRLVFFPGDVCRLVRRFLCADRLRMGVYGLGRGCVPEDLRGAVVGLWGCDRLCAGLGNDDRHYDWVAARPMAAVAVAAGVVDAGVVAVAVAVVVVVVVFVVAVAAVVAGIVVSYAGAARLFPGRWVWLNRPFRWWGWLSRGLCLSGECCTYRMRLP